MATAKFAFNNKVYIVIKLLLFKVNYGRELKNRLWNKKKEKVCKSRGVCKKNKKDIWESESSIEEVTRGDKEIYRYK